jgi:hypothetical protein
MKKAKQPRMMWWRTRLHLRVRAGQKVREVPAWGHPRVAVLPVAVKGAGHKEALAGERVEVKVADFQEGLGAARVAGKAGHKVGKVAHSKGAA